VYWNIPGFDTTTGAMITPNGLFVAVDLQALVTEAVASPLAPSWFAPIVKSTCEHFGFIFGMRPSLTSAGPVF
jgi:hypothetical protein